MLVYYLVPPGLSHTPEAPLNAAVRLREMGPVSAPEKIMMAAVATAVVLWVCLGVSVSPPVLLNMCCDVFKDLLPRSTH